MLASFNNIDGFVGFSLRNTPSHCRTSIGSDIMMQLDDVIATTSPDHERMQKAMQRSVRWLDRCIAAHKKPETQNLFCIIQGGLNLDHAQAVLRGDGEA